MSDGLKSLVGTETRAIGRGSRGRGPDRTLVASGLSGPSVALRVGTAER